MEMVKKAYEIPAVEITTLKTARLMGLDALSGKEDPLGGAPQRRSMPEGGDKAF